MDNNSTVITLITPTAGPLANLLGILCHELGETMAKHSDLIDHHTKVLADHDAALVADKQQLSDQADTLQLHSGAHSLLADDLVRMREGLKHILAQVDSHETLLNLHTTQLRGVDKRLDGESARLDALTPPPDDEIPDAEIHCPNCDCPRLEGVWIERIEPQELLAVFKEQLLANMETLLERAGQDKTPNWWQGAKAAIGVVTNFGPAQAGEVRREANAKDQALFGHAYGCPCTACQATEVREAKDQSQHGHDPLCPHGHGQHADICICDILYAHAQRLAMAETSGR